MIIRDRIGRIAVFGAGHISSTYINLMEIDDLIEFVVDDDSNKQDLYMPGSGLPIKKSISLINENVQLCLLTQNPESEKRVILNSSEFLEDGGKFVSIFPKRENSLQTIFPLKLGYEN